MNCLMVNTLIQLTEHVKCGQFNFLLRLIFSNIFMALSHIVIHAMFVTGSAATRLRSLLITNSQAAFFSPKI